MGVPAFFRWLTIRYPKTVIDATPSNMRYEMPPIDNLYLDMNGIIHPCCNPPEGPKPESFSEMCDKIYQYVDELVNIVQPRKLIYIAIDGVAPRAKLNQQRGRRFRKIQEEREKAQRLQSENNDLILQGVKANEIPQQSFDSNVITPGTQFMAQLAVALHEYIVRKVQGVWGKLAVIFSDSNNPGEGEHKILDFIRSQRSQPEYSPNIRHCIYGADADLIMLSLITHEPHFYIIRESIMDFNRMRCRLCNQPGHLEADCRGAQRQMYGEHRDREINIEQAKFQFVCIPVLRQYLYYEFGELRNFRHYNFERILDDFVFLCFFVGNDFLPHLPSLHIREGAIDGLMFLYCQIFHKLGGYLTENGKVIFYRVDILLQNLTNIETEWFLERQTRIDRLNRSFPPIKRRFEERKRESSDQAAQRVINEVEDLLEMDKKNIRVGEEGWKLRYYHEKYGVTNQEYEEFRQRIHKYYMEGLQWVFEYYYNGCPSWGWYFPFHYAPFASDLYDSGRLQIDYKLGEPFMPLVQLMAVLPPESKDALPRVVWPLVTQPNSPIIDFYPKDFKLDINGKRFAWQGVFLLPFIEEDRLRTAITPYLDQLTVDEQDRNAAGQAMLYSQHLPTHIYLNLTESNPNSFKYRLSQNARVRLWVIFTSEKPQHSSDLLPGTVEPQKVIDEGLFRQCDRSGFNGFRMISLIRKHLPIPDHAQRLQVDRADLHRHFTPSFNNNRPFLPEPAYSIVPESHKRPPPDRVPRPELISNLAKLNNLLGNAKKS